MVLWIGLRFLGWLFVGCRCIDFRIRGLRCYLLDLLACMLNCGSGFAASWVSVGFLGCCLLLFRIEVRWFVDCWWWVLRFVPFGLCDCLLVLWVVRLLFAAICG